MSGYFNATLTTVLDDGEEIDAMCEVDTNTQMNIQIEELCYMGDEEDMEDIESRVKREYVTLDENNKEFIKQDAINKCLDYMKKNKSITLKKTILSIFLVVSSINF